ncbi:E3 ubiquitin-protein ligase SINA-like 3 [Curcuma longa]|uniref:E3 ubiquitin-protein ligase SINA-like 3 n=1 Tax=Curcuma longa TaxID=136217 RepID=UPI003D9F1A96
MRIKRCGGNKRKKSDPSSVPIEKMELEAAAEWTTARLKLHILRCGLCNGRLTPPVYQFEKGFVACHKCQKALTPSSSSTPVYIRNHSLEKVIESLSIPCSHSTHGCNEYLPYLGSSIANHEKDCSYAPRRCFVKECAFKAPNGALVQHLTAEHRIKIHNFSYDVPLRVSIGRHESLLVLRASNDGVDFVLLDYFGDSSKHYNNFSVVCCSQSRPSKKIFSKLVARSDKGGELSLKAPVEQWNGFFRTTVFLVVPPYFYDRDGKIDMEVYMYVED